MLPTPVHILGLGNLGKLIAHSLRTRYPDLPITLLFHRPASVDAWREAGESIEIVRNGTSNRQNGFTTELVSSSGGDIHNLVVATKTYTTVDALRPLEHRLQSSSALLFLQNGIGGTIDEVNDAVFTLPSSRPSYLAGIFNHGVYATSAFSSVHAGVADAVIGPVNGQQRDPVETQHHLALGRLIADCPDLAATLVPESELTHMQLQKLAVNAVINPLTVVFDCFNGELFQSDPIRALIKCLVAEIAAVLQAVTRSRSAPVDAGKMASFAVETLYTSIAAVGKRTAQNISSMRQDRRAGRQTEIDYINGYIVAEGARQGIACPLNAKLIDVVKEGKRLSTADITKVFQT